MTNRLLDCLPACLPSIHIQQVSQQVIATIAFVVVLVCCELFSFLFYFLFCAFFFARLHKKSNFTLAANHSQIHYKWKSKRVYSSLTLNYVSAPIDYYIATLTITTTTTAIATTNSNNNNNNSIRSNICKCTFCTLIHIHK